MYVCMQLHPPTHSHHRPNVHEGETDDDCEDPDRIVVFDDFSNLLFTLSDEASKVFQVKLFNTMPSND